MIIPYDQRFLERKQKFVQKRIPFSITAVLIIMFFIGLFIELSAVFG